MKKTLILTAGAAMAAVAVAVAAKPVALVGLGSLVVSVWALTFDHADNSDLFS